MFKYIFFGFLFFIFLTFNIYIVKILIVADMNPLCGTPGCVSFFIKKFFRVFCRFPYAAAEIKCFAKTVAGDSEKNLKKLLQFPNGYDIVYGCLNAWAYYAFADAG